MVFPRRIVWWLLVAVSVDSLSSIGLAREEIDLSGQWEYQRVPELTYPPPPDWKGTTVPGYLPTHTYDKAWLRTTFTIPGSMLGMRIKLLFGAVKYDSQVYVNGEFVGGHLNGYDPFEFDITWHARVRQANELLVGLSDSAPLFTDRSGVSNTAAEPGSPGKNVVVSPMGGRRTRSGIWQTVRLRSVPNFSIEDVFVMTSVRARKIKARVRLRNEGPMRREAKLTGNVLEGEEFVLALSDVNVSVGAGETTELEVEEEWPDPRLWSPSDPHLYHLETTLKPTTGLVDMVRTRFGFREFWCEGDSFCLNGTKIHLLGTSAWPPYRLMRKYEIRRVLLDVRGANTSVLRLHTQPWEEKWYDLADELGLLIIEEGAVWCSVDNYRLGDAGFWSNFADHLRGMVRRDRNHPSIVMWSLENELIHSAFGRPVHPGTEAELAKLSDVVREMDPTRPITYEGDLDPGGKADVIGLHYPHEFPGYHIWPNMAYWMDQPIEITHAPGRIWKWNREKPLHIGEFLWIPGLALYYDSYSILFGDDAYTNPAYYQNEARAWTWQMQVEAYRDYAVSGVSPYSMFRDMIIPLGTVDLKPKGNRLYQVQKAVFHPNAVFVKEYDTRFFVGEEVARSVSVYNDTMQSGEFILKWGVGAATSTLALCLDAGERTRQTLSFVVPSTPGDFSLVIQLLRGDTPVFSDQKVYRAYARTKLSLPKNTRLALYDTEGRTPTLFGTHGISYRRVSDLRAAPYDEFDILVIGRDSLKKEPTLEVGPESVAAKWENFVTRGGSIIILEQASYPRWMPFEPILTDYRTNFVFPRAVSHPIVTGLTPEDLRWWRGDNRVTLSNILKPSRGNFRVLMDVGSLRGLDRAAVIEIPRGRGGYLCSQLLLATRFPTEPMAGMLLQRILDYCGTSKQRMKHVGLVAEADSEAAKTLARLGLLYENVSGRLATCDLSTYAALIIAGGENAWNEAEACLDKLTSNVEAGGKLLLHRPTEDFLTKARPVLFPNLTWSPNVNVPVLRSTASDCASSLSNYDLYWIDQPGNWDTMPVLSKGIAERVYETTSPGSEVFITRPGALVRVNRGRGFVLLDEIAWEREQKNRTKADRIVSTILTDLGASINMPVGLRVEAEEMKPVGFSEFEVREGMAWCGSNGRLETSISFAESGDYSFCVTGYGTPALGVYPMLELWIDSTKCDSLSVDSEHPGEFVLSANVAKGTHTVALAFVNDHTAPPEDRNLVLDRTTVSSGRESVRRVLNLSLNRNPGTARLTWEAKPGDACRVEFANDLLGDTWRSVENITGDGPVMSWVDDGTWTGLPPGDEFVRQRFYRVATRGVP